MNTSIPSSEMRASVGIPTTLIARIWIGLKRDMTESEINERYDAIKSAVWKERGVEGSIGS